jgi:4-hydroxy-tetrahydrodipicolinate synthase
VNITPETMARMADLPEVVAVKEASGSLGQMAEIVQLCGDKLQLLSGDDNLILPLLSLGGAGVISVLANFWPQAMAELHDKWFAGDVKGAQDAYYRLLPVAGAMFLETNPIPCKTACHLLGLIPDGSMRLPLCELAPANLERLKQVLADAGLLS